MKGFFAIMPLCVVLIISCSKSHPKRTDIPDGKGYFSIQQYFQDYEEYNLGQPYMVIKKVTRNGYTDSAIIAADSIGWDNIKEQLALTDIGYPEFIGRYEFTSSTNQSDQIYTFKYEAKELELTTKKLEVSVDNFNNKVRYLFMEWQDHSWYASTTKHFYFAPLKTLKIVTETDPLIGTARKEIVEYIYLTD